MTRLHRVLFSVAGLLLCMNAMNGSARAESVSAEVARGEKVYSRCLACHALEYDRTGPHHCGLFGRQAGSVEGFMYSDAMKSSHIVWNDETLDWFLRNPMRAIPGTSMGYAGIPDDGERHDLLAYLKERNASPQCQTSH